MVVEVWRRGWHITDTVGQLVPPQVTVSPEHLFALVALIRLVVCVSQQVGFEVRSLVEAPVAYWALVRRLFHVEDFVYS